MTTATIHTRGRDVTDAAVVCATTAAAVALYTLTAVGSGTVSAVFWVVLAAGVAAVAATAYRVRRQLIQHRDIAAGLDPAAFPEHDRLIRRARRARARWLLVTHVTLVAFAVSAAVILTLPPRIPGAAEIAALGVAAVPVWTAALQLTRWSAWIKGWADRQIAEIRDSIAGFEARR